jgi:hypothetical protein
LRARHVTFSCPRLAASASSLVAHLDGQTFASRLQTSCQTHLREPDVRKNAELNWYVTYGEPLPA